MAVLKDSDLDARDVRFSGAHFMRWMIRWCRNARLELLQPPAGVKLAVSGGVLFRCGRFFRGVGQENARARAADCGSAGG